MYLNFANRSTIWSEESSYQLYACSSVNYYQVACRMVLCENIFMRVVGASFRKKTRLLLKNLQFTIDWLLRNLETKSFILHS